MSNLDLGRIAAGLVISSIIGGAAYWRRSLTSSGWLGAVITGTATFGFGGWTWGLLLISFFVTSTLLSRYKQSLKARQAEEKFEKGSRRDLGQALANGGLAGLLAIASPFMGTPWWLFTAYLGVIATVTADTWATELGVLSRHTPRLITTGRPVAPGTSGGITLQGTLAAGAGGLCMGIIATIGTLLTQFGSGSSIAMWGLAPLGLICGLAGALFDSLLGATVQVMYRRPDGSETERTSSGAVPHAYLRGIPWLNNDAVNFLSSLVGGLIGAAIGLFQT